MPPPSPAQLKQTDGMRDQELTLDVLRHLVRTKWRHLPGSTLVVLSRDSEGNLYSPFSTFNHGRYAPVHGFTGEVYPLESDLAKDPALRALYREIPETAVAALVLFPLD